jgi:chemotaxis protein MotB
MGLDDSEFERDSSVRAPKRRSSVLPWMLFLLTLAAAGGLGYLGYGMWAAEKNTATLALSSGEEARVRAKEHEEARRALESKLSALESEKAELLSERDSLSEEVKAKDSEIAKLKATYDSLEDKMNEEIKKGDIRLTQLAGKIRVDMVDKILFDSGSADLSPRGQEVLARIGEVLAKVDDKQIQVSGHTDDVPIADKVIIQKFPTNWELSVARAVNVVRCLTEKGKVPSRRLMAAGYGQFQPIASNATPTGRARNRRIEILLTPVLQTKSGAKVAEVKAAKK